MTNWEPLVQISTKDLNLIVKSGTQSVPDLGVLFYLAGQLDCGSAEQYVTHTYSWCSKVGSENTKKRSQMFCF